MTSTSDGLMFDSETVMMRDSRLSYRCPFCGVVGFAPNDAVATIWSLDGCEDCTNHIISTAKRLVESTVLVIVLGEGVLDPARMARLQFLTTLGHSVYTLVAEPVTPWIKQTTLDSLVNLSIQYERSVLIAEDLTLRIQATRTGITALTWSQFDRSVLEPFMRQFGVNYEP